VAPAELPLSTTPVARLRRFEKWWAVILTFIEHERVRDAKEIPDSY
jgi:hypothetical protein